MRIGILKLVWGLAQLYPICQFKHNGNTHYDFDVLLGVVAWVVVVVESGLIRPGPLRAARRWCHTQWHKYWQPVTNILRSGKSWTWARCGHSTLCIKSFPFMTAPTIHSNLISCPNIHIVSKPSILLVLLRLSSESHGPLSPPSWSEEIIAIHVVLWWECLWRFMILYKPNSSSLYVSKIKEINSPLQRPDYPKQVSKQTHPSGRAEVADRSYQRPYGRQRNNTGTSDSEAQPTLKLKENG